MRRWTPCWKQTDVCWRMTNIPYSEHGSRSWVHVSADRKAITRKQSVMRGELRCVLGSRVQCHRKLDAEQDGLRCVLPQNVGLDCIPRSPVKYAVEGECRLRTSNNKGGSKKTTRPHHLELSPLQKVSRNFMPHEKVTIRFNLKRIWIFGPAHYLPILQTNLEESWRKTQGVRIATSTGCERQWPYRFFYLATGESQVERPYRSLARLLSQMAGFDFFFFFRWQFPVPATATDYQPDCGIIPTLLRLRASRQRSLLPECKIEGENICLMQKLLLWDECYM